MMGKLIPFNSHRRVVVAPVSESINDPFMVMVGRDSDNLASATGKTSEEAIQIASDFYKRYPMLMEFVRSPEFMLRNK